MSGVTVRSAETDDAEELTDQWVELADGQRAHGSHVLPVENRASIRESILRHVVGGSVLVARDSDIVGFVMFTVESGTFEQDLTRGVVENIYVVPQRRGEGIGSRLLTAAERALGDRDVDAVSLEVMADNRRAREFYAGHGYEPHRVELEKGIENDTHSKADQ